MATVRIYVRASTKDQNAERALADLVKFSKDYSKKNIAYIENYSGTKLDRPQLTKLLNEAKQGDILLVESVDRLSRLSQDEFAILKQRIKDKGLRLVVADLPTTHTVSNDSMTGEILKVVNNMLIDLLATMAKLDNDKRKERIKQGILLFLEENTEDISLAYLLKSLVKSGKIKASTRYMTFHRAIEQFSQRHYGHDIPQKRYGEIKELTLNSPQRGSSYTKAKRIIDRWTDYFANNG